jgi:hypothetical protein
VSPPRLQRAGTLAVTGLVGDPLTVEINAGTYYEVQQLPNPPFDPGARIQVSASGDQVPAFTLRGLGVEPLAVAPGTAWVIRSGEPLEITWQGSDSEELLHLVLTVDQHGASPVSVICDVPDVGSYMISAALVQTFLDYGVTGYPNAKLVRRSADHVASGAGCIELLVHSTRDGELSVEGHTPCSASDPCPAPLVCDVPTGTCI